MKRSMWIRGIAKRPIDKCCNTHLCNEQRFELSDLRQITQNVRGPLPSSSPSFLSCGKPPELLVQGTGATIFARSLGASNSSCGHRC
jgi:hypothetical protein